MTVLASDRFVDVSLYVHLCVCVCVCASVCVSADTKHRQTYKHTHTQTYANIDACALPVTSSFRRVVILASRGFHSSSLQADVICFGAMHLFTGYGSRPFVTTSVHDRQMSSVFIGHALPTDVILPRLCVCACVRVRACVLEICSLYTDGICLWSAN